MKCQDFIRYSRTFNIRPKGVLSSDLRMPHPVHGAMSNEARTGDTDGIHVIPETWRLYTCKSSVDL